MRSFVLYLASNKWPDISYKNGMSCVDRMVFHFSTYYYELRTFFFFDFPDGSMI